MIDVPQDTRASDETPNAADAGRKFTTEGGDRITVRQAHPEDEDDVVAFTSDTWSDRRDDGDYIPRVFADWVESDGPDQRTFVLDVNDGEDIAGILQAVMLSPYEGWTQGMRVNPEYRGLGLSRPLSNAAFEWCRDRGARVARAMVFSWNVAGLGQSGSVGFEPVAEFRFANPEPDATATVSDDRHKKVVVATGDEADPIAAWSYWSRSEAREALSGLAMDDGESWSLSELPRDRLEDAADDDRLITVEQAGIAGFTYRDRTYERTSPDGTSRTTALYAVAGWETEAAARGLYRAIARDAAAVDADRTRVLIPEGPRWVGQTARARVPVSDYPDFVIEADLTDPSIGW